MLDDILTLLRELIEGGFIGQAVLGTLIWGAIAYLSITHVQVDDRLWSAGLVILGYFFHMLQAGALSKSKADCLHAQNNAGNAPFED